MERRDFFGILAAPLLRRFTPPAPVASLAARNVMPAWEALKQLSAECGFSVTLNDDHAVFTEILGHSPIQQAQAVFAAIYADVMDRAILSNYGEIAGPVSRPAVVDFTRQGLPQIGRLMGPERTR